MRGDSIYGTVVASSELSGGSNGKVQRRQMCHSVSYHSYTAKFSTCPINLICLARAGMYSVDFNALLVARFAVLPVPDMQASFKGEPCIRYETINLMLCKKMLRPLLQANRQA